MKSYSQLIEDDLAAIELAILKHDVLEMIRTTKSMPCRTMAEAKVIFNELNKADKAALRVSNSLKDSSLDELKDECSDILDELEYHKAIVSERIKKAMPGLKAGMNHPGKTSGIAIAGCTLIMIGGAFGIKYILERRD